MNRLWLLIFVPLLFGGMTVDFSSGGIDIRLSNVMADTFGVLRSDTGTGSYSNISADARATIKTSTGGSPQITYTASTGDQVKEIWFLGRESGGNAEVNLGVYSMSGGLPASLLDSTFFTPGNPNAWYGQTGLTWALSNGVEYCLAIVEPSGSTLEIKGIAGSSGDRSDCDPPTCNSNSFTATWTEGSSSSVYYAMHAVFTNTGGGPTANRRRAYLINTGGQ